MQRRAAGFLALTSIAAGCAPQPTIAVSPAIFSQGWSERVTASDAPRLSLARLLGAPALEALIAAGVAQNADLAGARARTDQALALLRIARGAGLPLVTGRAGSGASLSSRSAALDFGDSILGIDATLSLDLSGRERARQRAAAARVVAGQADAEALALQLSAEIARAYVQRATLARRLALIDTSIGQAGELDRIIRVRNREGAASKVEVGLQSIRLRQLQAERSRVAEALGQTRTALAYLTGAEAPSFELAPADLSIFATPDLAVPTPLQLAERRPDLRAAEARIRAANGDVAAARRAFYPSFDLSIGGALKSGPGAPLALLGNIGADVFATIFGRNRLRGELEYASAQQREIVSAYRATLLNAFREVEDAMAAIRHAEERERLLIAVEAEARATEALARQQYLEGAEDLQHLLDAQDLLVSVQDAGALARQERIEALVRLYAATGSSAG